MSWRISIQITDGIFVPIVQMVDNFGLGNLSPSANVNNLLTLADEVIKLLFIFDKWRRKMSNIENLTSTDISVHADQVHFLTKICSKFKEEYFEHFKSPWSI